MRRLILPALIASMVAVVFAAAATYMQFTLIGQERRDALSAGRTEHMAAMLAGRLQGYADVVEAKARQQAVVQALAVGDRAALDRFAGELHQVLPDALRVRFLRLGEESIDESTTPSISYACLDLARTAEAGKVPPVEIHLFGNNNQHVALLRAVKGDKGVAGSLSVAFDVGVLKNWLQNALPADGGYAELRQGDGGKYLMLAAAGDAAMQNAPGHITQRVSGTSWDLVYWTPESVPALSVAQQSAFFTVFGVVAAVLIATFVLLTALASRIVKNDLVAVVKHGLEMWSGQPQHAFNVRLIESIEVLAALEVRYAELHAKQQPVQRAVFKAEAKQAAQKEAALEAELDLSNLEEPPPEFAELPTSLMFMEKGGIEVEELGPEGISSEGDKEK